MVSAIITLWQKCLIKIQSTARTAARKTSCTVDVLTMQMVPLDTNSSAISSFLSSQNKF